MTRLQHTRRELLKSGAAMSAAVSFAKYGITPSWSAAGAKKDELNVVDEVLRQAAETKEVPGVVAVAANSDGVIYEGAFGKRDLATGTDMTADSVFWIASMTKALTATAAVTNSGSVAGEEVVQLYVRLEGTSTAQPVRALKGFQRVSLAPGETKKVTFNLAPDAFALWSIDNQFTVEAAKATVWISPNSAAGTGTPLEITP